MRRLVWAFAGRTYHIVGNILSWLISKAYAHIYIATFCVRAVKELVRLNRCVARMLCPPLFECAINSKFSWTVSIMHSYCDIRLQVIVYSVAANIPEIPDFSHKLFGAYCDSYNVSEFFSRGSTRYPDRAGHCRENICLCCMGTTNT